MITLHLDRYRKGRIWIGELPDIQYKVADIAERRLENKAPTTAEPRCAAVELFIPTGARALYGLLGADFTPAEEQLLIVQVAISGAGENTINWSLAGRVDMVFVGIPQEFAIGVLDGACSAEEIRLLGPGVLNFCCAAYGHVGSSLAFFRRLSGAVVRLLASNNKLISQDELARLLQL